MTNTDHITPGSEPKAVISRPSDTRFKPRKSKKARASFTLPMLEFLLLKTLKLRSSQLGSPVKKNVLVRAGIQALSTMSDAHFLVALNTVSTSRNTRASKD